MPVLSRFYGLVVYMNYREHNPPHFHAKYQGFEVSIEIESGIVTGNMPSRALKLLFEWMELHKDELIANWKLAEQRKALTEIEPLK